MLGLDEAAAGFWRVNDWRISLQEKNVTPFITVISLTLRGKAGLEYAVPE